MSPKSTRKLIRRFIELDIDWKEWLALKVADRAANLKREPFKPGRIKKIANKFLYELEPPEDDGPKPIFEKKDLAMSGTQVQKILHIGPSQLVGVVLEFLMKQVVGDPSMNTYVKLRNLLVGRKRKRKLPPKHRATPPPFIPGKE